MTSKTPVGWTVRGIGTAAMPGCFVCGANPDTLMSNLSAFAATKGEAYFLRSCFERGAYVDFRPHEPHWIQVKVGACETHLPVLRDLAAQWYISEYHIDVMIEAALAADRWAERKLKTTQSKTRPRVATTSHEQVYDESPDHTTQETPCLPSSSPSRMAPSISL